MPETLNYLYLQGEVSQAVKTEPYSRSVSLYIFRHAEAISRSREAVLTDLGYGQARELGNQLAQGISSGECVRFLFSPFTRAVQTVEGVSKGLRDVMGAEIRFGPKRPRPAIEEVHFPSSGGFYDAMAASGDPVSYWLENPSDEVVTSEEVLGDVVGLVHHTEKLAKRLPEGPPIHLIAMSHTPNVRVLLRDIFEVDFGNMGNCMGPRIDFVAGERLVRVAYKRRRAEIHPEAKVLFLSEEDMFEFWRARLGDELLPTMDMETATSNANEGIILINTKRVPERLERYFIAHEKAELAIRRGELDPLSPESTVLRLGLRGYFVNEAQARSLYEEYLLAYEEGVLDELHEYSEGYYDRFLAGRFPDDSRPVYNWRIDIEARRRVKEVIEEGVRL